MSAAEVRQQVEYVALVTKQASSISDLRRFAFSAPAIKVSPSCRWAHEPRRVASWPRCLPLLSCCQGGEQALTPSRPPPSPSTLHPHPSGASGVLPRRGGGRLHLLRRPSGFRWDGWLGVMDQ